MFESSPSFRPFSTDPKQAYTTIPLINSQISALLPDLKLELLAQESNIKTNGNLPDKIAHLSQLLTKLPASSKNKPAVASFIHAANSLNTNGNSGKYKLEDLEKLNRCCKSFQHDVANSQSRKLTFGSELEFPNVSKSVQNTSEPAHNIPAGQTQVEPLTQEELQKQVDGLVACWNTTVLSCDRTFKMAKTHYNDLVLSKTIINSDQEIVFLRAQTAYNKLATIWKELDSEKFAGINRQDIKQLIFKLNDQEINFAEANPFDEVLKNYLSNRDIIQLTQQAGFLARTWSSVKNAIPWNNTTSRSQFFNHTTDYQKKNPPLRQPVAKYVTSFGLSTLTALGVVHMKSSIEIGNKDQIKIIQVGASYRLVDSTPTQLLNFFQPGAQDQAQAFAADTHPEKDTEPVKTSVTLNQDGTYNVAIDSNRAGAYLEYKNIDQGRLMQASMRESTERAQQRDKDYDLVKLMKAFDDIISEACIQLSNKAKGVNTKRNWWSNVKNQWAVQFGPVAEVIPTPLSQIPTGDWQATQISGRVVSDAKNGRETVIRLRLGWDLSGYYNSSVPPKLD